MIKLINRLIHKDGIVLQIHCALLTDDKIAGVGGVYHTYEVIPETFVPLVDLTDAIILSWIPEYFWIDLERQLILQIQNIGITLESINLSNNNVTQ